MNCEQCGAVVAPGLLACPYCKAPTQAAAAAKAREDQEAQARAHWAAAEQHQRSVTSRVRMEAVATQAVIWAAVGTVVCWPAAIVAIIQGLRARALAAEINEKPPVRAVVAMVLGSLLQVATVVAVIAAIVSAQGQEQRANARIADIDRQVAATAKAPVLDHDTACKLAEAYALKNGFDGTTGYTLTGFECAGKLAAHSDHAQLENFRFHSDSSHDVDAFACFKRGDAWFVSDLQKEACKGGGGAESSAYSPTAQQPQTPPKAQTGPAPLASGAPKAPPAPTKPPPPSKAK